MNKFYKPEKDPDMNPVDYFNQYGSWSDVFKNIKTVQWINDSELTVDGNNKPGLRVDGIYLHVLSENMIGLIVGKIYTKFMAYSKLQFRTNYREAISQIEFKKLNHDIPYIRVGTDYFKLITKKDRYGVERKVMKAWKKEEIKQDDGKNILNFVHRFNDFCIEPDNMNHQVSYNQCYNLYAEFSHTPYDGVVKPKDIPVSLDLMSHIFGEQYEFGMKYLKVLFEHPRQALPVLCLVSTERQTGKTTFLNWISMIFGDNYTQINPEDLSSQFNSSYATKNIIAIDETVVEKSHAVEKLKSLATAKTISVNQKHVANYMLPFFGKIIICTNKEKDFMRIDEEEIRFWIRKINSISKINTKIEDQLRDEIPYFLKYINQLPTIDTSKSRMIFTAEEISNKHLDGVKKESWSGLRKDLHLLISDYFARNEGADEFYATPTDIKDHWFRNNSNIPAHYIGKVLKDEMKMVPKKQIRYVPIYYIEDKNNNQRNQTKPGTPFHFTREVFFNFTEPNEIKQVKMDYNNSMNDAEDPDPLGILV